MIEGPQIVPDILKQNWLYEAALQEVVSVIPPQLTDATMIRLDDVRSLMIAAWLRGATWERERDSK